VISFILFSLGKRRSGPCNATAASSAAWVLLGPFLGNSTVAHLAYFSVSLLWLASKHKWTSRHRKHYRSPCRPPLARASSTALRCAALFACAFFASFKALQLTHSFVRLSAKRRRHINSYKVSADPTVRFLQVNNLKR
jgi:hypothetical protein